jgi:predicted ATPase
MRQCGAWCVRLRQIAARSSWKRIWLRIFVLQRQRGGEAADRKDALVGKLGTVS